MTINVAFRLIGGIGKAVLQLNFIKRLYEYLDDSSLTFVLYYLDDHKINEVLFRKQPFVHDYHKLSVFSQSNHDIAIDLFYFPDVLVCTENAYQSLSPKFKELIDSWRLFKQNSDTGELITKLPDSQYNICKYLEIIGKTALDSLDITNVLSITDITYKIYVNPEKEKFLQKYKLQTGKYITIN